MAKVPFSKFKCKINTDQVPIEINGETVNVRQYLPVNDKLALVGRVIELAHDQDYNFSNPIKVEIYTDLEIIYAYTDITFTDKQKEDTGKLYDLLLSSGILLKVKEAIPFEEIKDIYEGVEKSIESFYKYQNSVLGIMDTIKNDYDGLNLDWEKLNNNVKDPETLALLKEVLSKID